MAKTLMAFFSRADENYFGGSMRYIEVGNTEVVARKIKDMIGADLFKIEMKTPYAKDYNTCIAEAKEHQKQDARPELKSLPTSIDAYETVILGYPNYWGTMPRAVFSFLKALNDEHIVIHPFITHDGGDYGTSLTDIKTLCPHATITEPLSLKCTHIQCQLSAIENWVKKGSHDNG